MVGGGIAGMTSALSLADQGFEVFLVEKNGNLGGMARRIHYTLEGMDVQTFLNDMIHKVYRHPLIQCHASMPPSRMYPDMWEISSRR